MGGWAGEYVSECLHGWVGEYVSKWAHACVYHVQGTSTILCVPVEHISEIVDSGMERLAASPRAARTVTRKGTQ